MMTVAARYVVGDSKVNHAQHVEESATRHSADCIPTKLIDRLTQTRKQEVPIPRIFGR